MAELQAKPRAFADAWAPGPSRTAAVVAAARAAGYIGDEAALRTSGLRLLRDERVRARIEARFGRPIDELLAEAKVAEPAVAQESPKGLVKGRGRGTATERIEIAMALARSKKVDPKDRLNAVELAAELEGELRRGRGGVVGRPALPVPEAPPAPTVRPAGPRRLTLVTNERDAERAR